MREIEGLAAIVTGAARNIGRAIALDLAEGGALLAVVTKSDMEGANAVTKEIESKVASHRGNKRRANPQRTKSNSQEEDNQIIS